MFDTPKMKVCTTCAERMAGVKVEPSGSWATGKCERCGKRAVIAAYVAYKPVLSDKREEKDDEIDPYDLYIGCF
jgi:hypothetical protein